MVTIQGIIDAFLIEEGKIILGDYKTDRVGEAGELIARYQTQLNLYAEACLQKAYGIPLRRSWIYSTALGREISLVKGRVNQEFSYNLNKMYEKKDTNDGEYPQETDLCMKIVCRKSTKDML